MAWFQRKSKQKAGEKRATSGLASPAGWLVDLFGGGKTSAGLHINSRNSLTITTVYACIRILAETVAQLPLNVYRRTDDGKQVDVSNPLHDLLHTAPNAYMSSMVWRELQQSHVLSWGNGYAHIERNQRGRPVGLVLLRPDRTEPVVRGGEVVYEVTFDDGSPMMRVPAADILHIPALGFDGLKGYSPVTLHRESISVGVAAQQFGAEFFGSGAALHGVLETPNKLDAPSRENLREQWDQAYAGLGNKKTAVLVEGMKYQRIGIPPEDAQFLETRRFQREEIASIYNVPPHMIQDLSRATFSNISEQSLSFLRFSMMPWLRKWEDEMNRKLLTPTERRTLFIRFNVDGLLRGTLKERYEAYRLGIMTGFLSRNEVRNKEDLNREEGLDEFLVPLNMAEVDESGNTEPIVRMLEPLWKRFAEQMDLYTRQTVKKPVGAENHRRQIERTFGPIAQAAGEAGLADPARYVERMVYWYCTLREADVWPNPADTLDACVVCLEDDENGGTNRTALLDGTDG